MIFLLATGGMLRKKIKSICLLMWSLFLLWRFPRLTQIPLDWTLWHFCFPLVALRGFFWISDMNAIINIIWRHYNCRSNVFPHAFLNVYTNTTMHGSLGTTYCSSIGPLATIWVISFASFALSQSGDYLVNLRIVTSLVNDLLTGKNRPRAQGTRIASCLSVNIFLAFMHYIPFS